MAKYSSQEIVNVIFAAIGIIFLIGVIYTFFVGADELFGGSTPSDSEIDRLLERDEQQKALGVEEFKETCTQEGRYLICPFDY